MVNDRKYLYCCRFSRGEKGKQIGHTRIVDVQFGIRRLPRTRRKCIRRAGKGFQLRDDNFRLGRNSQELGRCSDVHGLEINIVANSNK